MIIIPDREFSVYEYYIILTCFINKTLPFSFSFSFSSDIKHVLCTFILVSFHLIYFSFLIFSSIYIYIYILNNKKLLDIEKEKIILGVNTIFEKIYHFVIKQFFLFLAF